MYFDIQNVAFISKINYFVLIDLHRQHSSTVHHKNSDNYGANVKTVTNSGKSHFKIY